MSLNLFGNIIYEATIQNLLTFGNIFFEATRGPIASKVNVTEALIHCLINNVTKRGC